MDALMDILSKREFSREEIVRLLGAEGGEMEYLLNKALEVKLAETDNLVRLRGLIEIGNVCTKDCFYCGLRRSNHSINRYSLTREQILECARKAYELGYGSVALQGGERSDEGWIEEVTTTIREIKKIGDLGITLSLGEQDEETYRRWFEAGAHRYLLRIETTDEELFYRIHPRDARHDFRRRIECIDTLKRIGFQTGTGVMIGLPHQTIGSLADDLLWFKARDVAMVGMGPYIPHPDTPLFGEAGIIPAPKERIALTLKMIAVLRLMMPRINMVAATANLTIDPEGREKAILAGANVIMPNLTPGEEREAYSIYPDKAAVSDMPGTPLADRMKAIGHRLLLGSWGDSLAFTERK